MAEQGRQLNGTFARRGLGLGWVLGVLAVCTLLAASIASPSRPLVVLNVSASSPQGFYLVTPAVSLRPGDTAVARPPASVQALAAERLYLPHRVPLVKRVAAVRGDRVCAAGLQVRVNGRLEAVRRPADPSGRLMPWWSGCLKLSRGQYLLLGQAGWRSFDGRYFGMSGQDEIVGKARLLWPR